MDLIAVGKVIRPHGIGGVVKVLSYSDDPTRLERVAQLYVGQNDSSPRGARVVGYQGRYILLKLEGSETREEANTLRGSDLRARVEDLPPLADGEYYVHDIVGLDVLLPGGEPVGTIVEVLSLPAGDVYVVETGEKRAMIPAVREFVKSVDLEGRRMVVEPPPGLLEL